MPTTQSAQPLAGAHVNKILEEMYGEFQSLMSQRAAILRRIGTIKQTIIGLAKLFGDEAVGENLLQVVEQRSSTRSRGFTRTCRVVLMESTRPMTCQEVYEDLRRRNPTLVAHHKDPLASVNTVLNRLAAYGEARIVMNERGKRAWEWSTERAAVGLASSKAQRDSSAPTVEPQKGQDPVP